MKNSILFLGLLVALTISPLACENSDGARNDKDPEITKEFTASEQNVVESANNFSFDLFSKINQNHQTDNVFISPFSISTALAMTLNGAKGSTQDAIKETLHLDQYNVKEINKAYLSLTDYLLEADNLVEINVANANWYRNEFHIDPLFKETLSQYYSAEALPADFKNPSLKNEMNQWIENSTNGKIKNMIDQIPDDAAMYLINAIYFKADWTFQFDKEKTQLSDFHLADGNTKPVETMVANEAKINYATSEDFQLIDIPYGNGKYYFTVLLPHKDVGINELAETLSADLLDGVLKDTTNYGAKIYMPKFKLAFKKELLETLEEMGIKDGGSDLSNMFEEDVDLFISRVLHQACIEVNEEGSEASAATTVEIGVTSIPAEPPVIYLNRPFLFYIRENTNNTILFSGKLMDPS